MSAPALDDRDGSKQVEDTVHRAYEVLRQEILIGVLHPGAVLSQVQAAAVSASAAPPRARPCGG